MYRFVTSKYSFYVSRKKRRGKKEADVKEEVNVKEEVKKHVREISSGPAVAQRHLRDLAQELHRRPSTSSMDKKSPGSKEEVLLEFQDLTDYGRYIHNFKVETGKDHNSITMLLLYTMQPPQAREPSTVYLSRRAVETTTAN